MSSGAPPHPQHLHGWPFIFAIPVGEIMGLAFLEAPRAVTNFVRAHLKARRASYRKGLPADPAHMFMGAESKARQDSVVTYYNLSAAMIHAGQDRIAPALWLR